MWKRYLLIPVILACVTLSLLSGCKRKQEGALFTESSRKATAEPPVKEVPKDLLATQQAFTSLAQAVTPAVVNIAAVSRKKVAPAPGFPFAPFFDGFLDQPRYRRDQSLGSGFIISKQGYIVTNDHVVRDAVSIKVKLSNENVYDATLVGSDPKTDIAVLRINPREELPVAVLGDSDQLRVGQWAVAIGNPFGLDRTFTVGVISATGRSNVGIEAIEDFIQTDASINPGNSGGPLLNIHGEVVGINTAIVASGQGIGFAIPVNMAKKIVAQLVEQGKVERGWLGVVIQPLTDELATSFGLKKSRGALVADVMAGSPAEQAGLRQGDVILKVDSVDVKDARHLQRLVGELKAGQRAAFEVFRGGKTLLVTATVGNADSAAAKAARPAGAASEEVFGLSVQELPPSARARGARGVLVAELDPDGLAARGGMQPGDLIVGVNKQPVGSVADFRRLVQAATGRQATVTLQVKRDGMNIYFSFHTR